MRIEKIVNNNVVTAIIDNDIEVVAMGKGIGFKKKQGDDLEEDKVDKIFKLDNPKTKSKIKELLEQIEPKYFVITQNIVKFAEGKLDKKLSEQIYVLLTDHLVFAVQRARENIRMQNPMLWEIKNLYKDEYKIGLWAISMIQEEFSVELPEDEAAFIALHVVNASLDEEIYNTMNITILTKDILRIIKNHFMLEFNEDSLDYIRLVTHLKFFAQRIFKREQVNEDDEELYELLSSKYTEEKKCLGKVSKYVMREFNYELTTQELVYLIIHIRKVTSKESN